MKKYFEQLNPQERRIVVGVALVAFVVLNLWFVRPHFHDLAGASARMARAQSTIQVFQTEIGRIPIYQRKVNDLKSGGEDVQLDDQAIYFDRAYREKAVENGVEIMGNSRPNTRTNEFFLEQEIGLSITAREKNLVDFLYSLGSGNSMIRVRSMSLHPGPNHQDLSVNITLVASFQKKSSAPARSGAAASSVAQGAPPAPASPAPAAPPVGAAPMAAAPGFPSSKINALTNRAAALTTNRHP